MSDASDANLRLTEAQVEATLKRAIELQNASTDSSNLEQRIAFDQLSEAANEIGISSNWLNQAAKEVLAGPRVPLVFDPKAQGFDRIVPGIVDGDDWQTLVDDLRRITGRFGPYISDANGFSWTPDFGLRVLIKSQGNGKTRVQVGNAYDMALPTAYVALSATIALVIPLFISGFDLHPVLTYFKIFALWILLFGLMCLRFQYSRMKRVRQINEILAAVDSFLK